MDGYLYQYLLGLPIFAAGLWAGFRSGLLGLSGRPLARLALVLGVLAVFAAGQGWLQYGRMAEAGTGLFAGMTQYEYMRAFFGIVVCAALALTTALLTRPEPAEKRRGLVSGEPCEHAMAGDP